jgi:hypothetical protein
MKKILSILFALAFALSGSVGHAFMVMDGAVTEHSIHSEHSADHVTDDDPATAHYAKAGSCADACAAACGFVSPLFQLKQRDFALDQPVACMRLAPVSAITGFDPPPPKA